MSTQYTENNNDKHKAEDENNESEEQFSDFTPLEGSGWTDEKDSGPRAEPDKQTPDDTPVEPLSKGTPSWVAMPDENLVEDRKTNPDLVEMEEIHELDELDRLDELDEVYAVGDLNEEYKEEVHFAQVITPSTLAGSLASLLNQEESDLFRSRWNKIQGSFVDEPKAAVQEAELLVSDVIEEMKKKFADELSALESQWKNGSVTTTEDLRLLLQLYRSFLNRLIGKT